MRRHTAIRIIARYGYDGRVRTPNFATPDDALLCAMMCAAVNTNERLVYVAKDGVVEERRIRLERNGGGTYLICYVDVRTTMQRMAAHFNVPIHLTLE